MIEDLVRKFAEQVLPLLDPLAVVVAMVGTELIKAVDKGGHDPGKALPRRSRGKLRRWYPLLPIGCALIYVMLAGGWQMPLEATAKALAYGAVASWGYRVLQTVLGKDKTP